MTGLVFPCVFCDSGDPLIFHQGWCGRVARQRTANPCTGIRIPPPPPVSHNKLSLRIRRSTYAPQCTTSLLNPRESLLWETGGLLRCFDFGKLQRVNSFKKVQILALLRRSTGCSAYLSGNNFAKGQILAQEKSIKKEIV